MARFDRSILTLAVLGVFFLTLFSSVAHAAPVDEVAKLYAQGSESVSTEKVSYNGANYYIVKLSGRESVVLKEVGASFQSVVNRDELMGLFKVYLSTKFESLPFNAAYAADLQTQFAIVNETISLCEPGFQVITDNPGSVTMRTLRVGRHADYPAEWNAYCQINPANIYCISDGKNTTKGASTADINASMTALAGAVANVGPAISSKNTDEVYASLTIVKDSATAVKTGYAIQVSSAAVLTATFPYILYVSGKASNCTASAQYTNAINALISSATQSAAYSSAPMSDHVIATTNAREAGAQTRRFAATANTAWNASTTAYASVAAKYSTSLGILLTSLDAQHTSLKADIALINQANTTAEAQSMTDAFLVKLRSFDAGVQSANAAFPHFEAAVKARNEANVQVNDALNRYGSSDDRVTTLKNQYTDLKSSLDTTTSEFQAGKTERVSTLNETTAGFNNVASTAKNLQAKENLLGDPVLLVGALVLLLAIGGGVWYFMKNRPPEAGDGKGKPLDIRDANKKSKDDENTYVP